MFEGKLLLGLRFFWSTLSSDCVLLRLLANRFMLGWSVRGEEPEVGGVSAPDVQATFDVAKHLMWL